MVHNINRPLKQEMVSTKENKTKIVKIEKNIIALGIDPKDRTSMGELVKYKDTKIKVLRKRLNLLESQHVKTPELQGSHEEKEQLYHQLVERKQVLGRFKSENESLQEEIETLRSQRT
jgi:hypothetical protein